MFLFNLKIDPDAAGAATPLPSPIKRPKPKIDPDEAGAAGEVEEKKNLPKDLTHFNKLFDLIKATKNEEAYRYYVNNKSKIQYPNEAIKEKMKALMSYFKFEIACKKVPSKINPQTVKTVENFIEEYASFYQANKNNAELQAKDNKGNPNQNPNFEVYRNRLLALKIYKKQEVQTTQIQKEESRVAKTQETTSVLPAKNSPKNETLVFSATHNTQNKVTSQPIFKNINASEFVQTATRFYSLIFNLGEDLSFDQTQSAFLFFKTLNIYYQDKKEMREPLLQMAAKEPAVAKLLEYLNQNKEQFLSSQNGVWQFGADTKLIALINDAYRQHAGGNVTDVAIYTEPFDARKHQPIAYLKQVLFNGASSGDSLAKIYNTKVAASDEVINKAIHATTSGVIVNYFNKAELMILLESLKESKQISADQFDGTVTWLKEKYSETEFFDWKFIQQNFQKSNDPTRNLIYVKLNSYIGGANRGNNFFYFGNNGNPYDQIPRFDPKSLTKYFRLYHQDKKTPAYRVLTEYYRKGDFSEFNKKYDQLLKPEFLSANFYTWFLNKFVVGRDWKDIFNHIPDGLVHMDFYDPITKQHYGHKEVYEILKASMQSEHSLNKDSHYHAVFQKYLEAAKENNQGIVSFEKMEGALLKNFTSEEIFILKKILYAFSQALTWHHGADDKEVNQQAQLESLYQLLKMQATGGATLSGSYEAIKSLADTELEKPYIAERFKNHQLDFEQIKAANRFFNEKELGEKFSVKNLRGYHVIALIEFLEIQQGIPGEQKKIYQGELRALLNHSNAKAFDVIENTRSVRSLFTRILDDVNRYETTYRLQTARKAGLTEQPEGLISAALDQMGNYLKGPGRKYFTPVSLEQMQNAFEKMLDQGGLQLIGKSLDIPAAEAKAYLMQAFNLRVMMPIYFRVGLPIKLASDVRHVALGNANAMQVLRSLSDLMIGMWAYRNWAPMWYDNVLKAIEDEDYVTALALWHATNYLAARGGWNSTWGRFATLDHQILKLLGTKIPGTKQIIQKLLSKTSTPKERSKAMQLMADLVNTMASKGLVRAGAEKLSAGEQKMLSGARRTLKKVAHYAYPVLVEPWSAFKSREWKEIYQGVDKKPEQFAVKELTNWFKYYAVNQTGLKGSTNYLSQFLNKARRAFNWTDQKFEYFNEGLSLVYSAAHWSGLKAERGIEKIKTKFIPQNLRDLYLLKTRFERVTGRTLTPEELKIAQTKYAQTKTDKSLLYLKGDHLGSLNLEKNEYVSAADGTIEGDQQLLAAVPELNRSLEYKDGIKGLYLNVDGKNVFVPLTKINLVEGNKTSLQVFMDPLQATKHQLEINISVADLKNQNYLSAISKQLKAKMVLRSMTSVTDEGRDYKKRMEDSSVERKLLKDSETEVTRLREKAADIHRHFNQLISEKYSDYFQNPATQKRFQEDFEKDVKNLSQAKNQNGKTIDPTSTEFIEALNDFRAMEMSKVYFMTGLEKGPKAAAQMYQEQLIALQAFSQPDKNMVLQIGTGQGKTLIATLDLLETTIQIKAYQAAGKTHLPFGQKAYYLTSNDDLVRQFVNRNEYLGIIKDAGFSIGVIQESDPLTKQPMSQQAKEAAYSKDIVIAAARQHIIDVGSNEVDIRKIVPGIVRFDEVDAPLILEAKINTIITGPGVDPKDIFGSNRIVKDFRKGREYRNLKNLMRVLYEFETVRQKDSSKVFYDENYRLTEEGQKLFDQLVKKYKLQNMPNLSRDFFNILQANQIYQLMKENQSESDILKTHKFVVEKVDGQYKFVHIAAEGGPQVSMNFGDGMDQALAVVFNERSREGLGFKIEVGQDKRAEKSFVFKPFKLGEKLRTTSDINLQQMLNHHAYRFSGMSGSAFFMHELFSAIYGKREGRQTELLKIPPFTPEFEIVISGKKITLMQGESEINQPEKIIKLVTEAMKISGEFIKKGSPKAKLRILGDMNAAHFEEFNQKLEKELSKLSKPEDPYRLAVLHRQNTVLAKNESAKFEEAAVNALVEAVDVKKLKQFLDGDTSVEYALKPVLVSVQDLSNIAKFKEAMTQKLTSKEIGLSESQAQKFIETNLNSVSASEISDIDFENKIKRARNLGMITVHTRIQRGIDIVALEKAIGGNLIRTGNMHVVLVGLNPYLALEIQSEGRTGRAEYPGSSKLIVSADEVILQKEKRNEALLKLLGDQNATEIKPGTDLYEKIIKNTDSKKLSLFDAARKDIMMEQIRQILSINDVADLEYRLSQKLLEWDTAFHDGNPYIEKLIDHVVSRGFEQLKDVKTLNAEHIKNLETYLKYIFRAQGVSLSDLEGLPLEKAKHLVSKTVQEKFLTRFKMNFMLEGPSDSNRMKQMWSQIKGQEVATYIEEKTLIRSQDSKLYEQASKTKEEIEKDYERKLDVAMKRLMDNIAFKTLDTVFNDSKVVKIFRDGPLLINVKASDLQPVNPQGPEGSIDELTAQRFFNKNEMQVKGWNRENLVSRVDFHRFFGVMLGQQMKQLIVTDNLIIDAAALKEIEKQVERSEIVVKSIIVGLDRNGKLSVQILDGTQVKIDVTTPTPSRFKNLQFTFGQEKPIRFNYPSELKIEVAVQNQKLNRGNETDGKSEIPGVKQWQPLEENIFEPSAQVKVFENGKLIDLKEALKTRINQELNTVSNKSLGSMNKNVRDRQGFVDFSSKESKSAETKSENMLKNKVNVNLPPTILTKLGLKGEFSLDEKVLELYQTSPKGKHKEALYKEIFKQVSEHDSRYEIKSTRAERKAKARAIHAVLIQSIKNQEQLMNAQLESSTGLANILTTQLLEQKLARLEKNGSELEVAQIENAYRESSAAAVGIYQQVNAVMAEEVRAYLFEKSKYELAPGDFQKEIWPKVSERLGINADGKLEIKKWKAFQYNVDPAKYEKLLLEQLSSLDESNPEIKIKSKQDYVKALQAAEYSQKRGIISSLMTQLEAANQFIHDGGNVFIYDPSSHDGKSYEALSPEQRSGYAKTAFGATVKKTTNLGLATTKEALVGLAMGTLLGLVSGKTDSKELWDKAKDEAKGFAAFRAQSGFGTTFLKLSAAEANRFAMFWGAAKSFGHVSREEQLSLVTNAVTGYYAFEAVNFGLHQGLQSKVAQNFFQKNAFRAGAGKGLNFVSMGLAMLASHEISSWIDKGLKTNPQIKKFMESKSGQNTALGLKLGYDVYLAKYLLTGKGLGVTRLLTTGSIKLLQATGIKVAERMATRLTSKMLLRSMTGRVGSKFLGPVGVALLIVDGGSVIADRVVNSNLDSLYKGQIFTDRQLSKGSTAYYTLETGKWLGLTGAAELMRQGFEGGSFKSEMQDRHEAALAECQNVRSSLLALQISQTMGISKQDAVAIARGEKPADYYLDPYHLSESELNTAVTNFVNNRALYKSEFSFRKTDEQIKQAMSQAQSVYKNLEQHINQGHQGIRFNTAIIFRAGFDNLQKLNQQIADGKDIILSKQEIKALFGELNEGQHDSRPEKINSKDNPVLVRRLQMLRLQEYTTAMKYFYGQQKLSSAPIDQLQKKYLGENGSIEAELVKYSLAMRYEFMKKIVRDPNNASDKEYRSTGANRLFIQMMEMDAVQIKANPVLFKKMLQEATPSAYDSNAKVGIQNSDWTKIISQRRALRLVQIKALKAEGKYDLSSAYAAIDRKAGLVDQSGKVIETKQFIEQRLSQLKSQTDLNLEFNDEAVAGTKESYYNFLYHLTESLISKKGDEVALKAGEMQKAAERQIQTSQNKAVNEFVTQNYGKLLESKNPEQKQLLKMEIIKLRLMLLQSQDKGEQAFLRKALKNMGDNQIDQKLNTYRQKNMKPLLKKMEIFQQLEAILISKMPHLAEVKKRILADIVRFY